ncbi:hypothetical protein [Brevundimonas subvibrioides]|uniref:hypothetical protein n=1 Tax=Brevundimonas subvibrioides TaxID=74313 RepID=UPI0022B3F3E7|nr:hypothetical protein [Brevundimonas subvibrioides]
MLTPIPHPANLAMLAIYTDMHLPLSVLFQHVSEAGKSVIEGKTFTRCDIAGPAVLLAAGGVEFQGCNMGPHGGDVRNLLLKPVGPKQVIGVIPVRNSRFIECRFHAIGFTGSDEFMDVFLKGLGEPGLAELAAR